MRLSANLRDGYTSRVISMEIPVIQNPLLPVPYVDSRWAHPYVFRNVALYPLAEVNDVVNDFNKLVSYVNTSSIAIKIDRYKDGLLKLIDAHIARCGRLLFCDLLMYIDCLAYLCYASDLMTESQILQNYASWAKFVVDKRKSSILCSTRWGAVSFIGSENERDLKSCL
jgi:hypothetical protein